MPVNIDSAFGIFPQALRVHERRTQLLANNIANQDTPGFKAQDIDFRKALQDIKSGQHINGVMQTSNAEHIQAADDLKSGYTLYRQPNQPSLDGNTVDEQVEQAEFAENSMRYLANLQFLNSKISGLMLAIKGSK